MSLVLDPQVVGGRGFLSPAGFGAHRSLTMVRIVIPELGRAISAFPLAFLDDSPGAPLVAILGLQEGQNLYISDDARWLTSYVPAWIRSHPFRLEEIIGAGKCLAIEDGADVLTDHSDARPLYDQGGTPSAFHREMHAFLCRLETCQGVADRAGAVLREMDLLEPWPIGLEFPDGRRHLRDLLRVREAALVDLCDEEFIQLRHAGALPLAYAQLLSMRNLTMLGWLWRLHAGATEESTPATEVLVDTDAQDLHFDFVESPGAAPRDRLVQGPLFRRSSS